LKKAIEKAEGPMLAGPMGSPSLPKFRPQIAQDQQRGGVPYTDLPRLKFKKEDWPCEIDEG
jgi:hypothetical protein